MRRLCATRSVTVARPAHKSAVNAGDPASRAGHQSGSLDRSWPVLPRNPARRPGDRWLRREHSFTRTDVPGVGIVQSWYELTGVSGELVSFRSFTVFEADDAVITSDSTLRFRERDAIAASLGASGYQLDEVRDAPDRPGREFAFIARRPS